MAITFSVSDVKSKPLVDWQKEFYESKPLAKVVPKLLGAKTEGRIGHESKGPNPKIEDFGGPAEALPSVEGPKQGLFDAVNHAYAFHLPLVLSPDHLWLTIAQGFARHVSQNAKELYPQLIAGASGEITKQKLEVRRDNFVKGKPGNDWPGVFEEFSQQIRAKTVPKTYERLICDFSTTGPLEKAVSNLTLMDTLQSYFTYEVHTMCGIPNITLTGTADDWRKLRAKASMLAEYGLSWWTERLLPVLDRFVLASEGNINVSWWQGLYKENGGSGGPSFSGHLNAFFPFLKIKDYNYETKIKTEYVARNKLPQREHTGRDGLVRKTDPWERTHTTTVPSGFVTVPFVWNYLQQTFNMQFVGGLVAVTQDVTGVSPAAVWAVCEASK